MKKVERVRTGMYGYRLKLEDGTIEKSGAKLNIVEDEDGFVDFAGLEHFDTIEEFFHIGENKKKRIIYLEDRPLAHIQEAYVCECGGTMPGINFRSGLSEDCGPHYDTVSTYKCVECGKEYEKKERHLNPSYEEEY